MLFVIAGTAFRSGDFDSAINGYTAAIDEDSGNYLLYSNRSAVRFSCSLKLSNLCNSISFGLVFKVSVFVI